jgi:sugar phosphate isomerase/epimerase
MALKETGYNGWMTIESFAGPDAELAAAAAIWRDLASSGDQLARRGLAFIKGLSAILESARLVASEFTEQAGVHGGGP